MAIITAQLVVVSATIAAITTYSNPDISGTAIHTLFYLKISSILLRRAQISPFPLLHNLRHCGLSQVGSVQLSRQVYDPLG